MSKVRDLPEITVLEGNDLLYAIDASEGANGGRKITKANLKASVDQSPTEIKTAYESNADTNAFTDAEKTKLASVESGATGDQNAAEVPYNNSVSGLSALQVNAAIDEVNTKAQADFRPSIVSGRILHYTGGTARFDGVFFELVGNDILLNQSVIAGEVYVDLDGVVKQTASGISAPPYTIVFARFSTDLINIISLTDLRVKNSQNIVRGLLADVRDVRAGAPSSEGNSGRVSDAMHKHAVLTGAPSTQLVNQGNSEGTSDNLARADHIHNFPTSAPTDTLTPATANTEGAGTNFARNDHTHAIATGLDADISTIQPDDSAAAGVVNKFARADHKHAIVADAPVSQTPAQANAEGSSTSFARADHVHSIPVAAPITNLSPATTNAEGVGTSFARNDHTHALSMAQAADLSTINAGDAEVLGSANRLARADHQHPVSTAAASTLNANSTNTEGASISLARADHTHDLATGAASTQTPAQANAEGVSTNLARADHVHNIPVAAPTTALTPATTNAEGVGTSFARNDHTHAIATALVGDITTIQPDAAAGAGTANTFARGDHRHAIVTDAPVNTGIANAEGASTSFARADHVHNTTIASLVASATADDTTTSATDVLIVGMTLTPAAGTYAAIFSSSVVNSGNGSTRLFVSIYSDGAQIPHTEREIGIAGGANTCVQTGAVITVNGSQAIEARWRAVAGTNTAHERSLTLIRLGN